MDPFNVVTSSPIKLYLIDVAVKKKNLCCLSTRKHDDSWVHTHVLNLYSEKYKISGWEWGWGPIYPLKAETACSVGQSLHFSPRDLDFRATEPSLHSQNIRVCYPCSSVDVCPLITELNLTLDLYWHELRGNSFKKPEYFRSWEK